MGGKRWWVVEDHILAGPMPTGPEDFSDLAEGGVSSVISLVEDDSFDLGTYREAWKRTGHAAPKVHHFPVWPDEAPTHEQAVQALRVMDEHLAQGRGLLYIHCAAGRSRTGSLVGAWLASRRGIPASRVEAWLRRARGREDQACLETEAQRALVASFEPRA